jgi:glutathione peroxidase
MILAAIALLGPATALDFTLPDLDGAPVDLAKFKGKAVLLVNVASKCGLTPQYAELQALYEKRKEDGLVILGFPANEFGGQEPGSNEEIKSFCAMNYGVTFPMFGKIVVRGEGIHPLYKFLTERETNEPFAGEIKWNFTKFLLDRTGKVVARFEPKVKPSAPEVEVDAAVTKALHSGHGKW